MTLVRSPHCNRVVFAGFSSPVLAIPGNFPDLDWHLFFSMTGDGNRKQLGAAAGGSVLQNGNCLVVQVNSYSRNRGHDIPCRGIKPELSSDPACLRCRHPIRGVWKMKNDSGMDNALKQATSIYPVIGPSAAGSGRREVKREVSMLEIILIILAVLWVLVYAAFHVSVWPYQHSAVECIHDSVYRTAGGTGNPKTGRKQRLLGIKRPKISDLKRNSTGERPLLTDRF